MILWIEGVTREPLLCLSSYFKQNHARYYELLDRVRSEGEWEEWVTFFTTGVENTANAAVTTARRLIEISRVDHTKAQGAGRIAGFALQVHHALLSRPISTIARLAKDTGLSVPPATDSLMALEQLGLVREITGRERGRVFVYAPYLDVLQQRMEPL